MISDTGLATAFNIGLHEIIRKAIELGLLTPEQMTTPNQSPELLGTVPNNPKDIEEALKYYEGQIANQPIENGIVITPDGEVYHTTGDEGTLSPILELGDKLNDATITHNHPTEETEYSFSNDDIALFMNYGLERLRGIDDKFVYELSRDPNEIDDPVFFGDVNEFNYRHSQVVDKARDYDIGYRRFSR